MQNYLKNQTSPYLLQHADNPVNWYPWCEEAFERAKTEDKPVFLSIGYSTCHWCHVMAHESFEDEETAEILNKYFIAVKVDKEERPDLDSIYMAVCQAFTGSGGWPTTIFLTPHQRPFFAGTYFPKTAQYGQPGLKEILLAIAKKWENNREELIKSADTIVKELKCQMTDKNMAVKKKDLDKGMEDEKHNLLIQEAFTIYKQTYDEKYGGFGWAPKFPTPHNLLFLMQYYEKTGDEEAMKMVEKTLLQMYRGGIYDHIGGGFCRYSTDEKFLVPHFEKMLYDNALLILTYCKAYQITKKYIYCDVAEKTASYILREMTSPEGGFYSAQDADSEGVEGKFYLFEADEMIDLLGGVVGNDFNQYFDITEEGNFEGKNIPNILKNPLADKRLDEYIPIVYEYRKKRNSLHTDDKVLTSWNGLMIGALCWLYRITENKEYLEAAKTAQKFVEDKLWEGDTLFVSYAKGMHGKRGFLDDYANEIFAMTALYEATLDSSYRQKIRMLYGKVVTDFYDEKNGGFFLYGKENEQLILRPKETYDGAIPSGNSIMAYNLVHLHIITDGLNYKNLAKQHLLFLSRQAKNYPAGQSVFLMALSDFIMQPEKVRIVLKDGQRAEELSCKIPLNMVITVLEEETEEYPLVNDRTTFYICRGHSCLPPVNELKENK